MRKPKKGPKPRQPVDPGNAELLRRFARLVGRSDVRMRLVGLYKGMPAHKALDCLMRDVIDLGFHMGWDLQRDKEIAPEED